MSYTPFKQMEAKLAAKPGVTNPGGLSAFIARKTYGNKALETFAQKTGGSGYVPKPIRTGARVPAPAQEQAAAQAQAQAQHNAQIVALNRRQIQHMQQIQTQHKLLSQAHQHAIAMFINLHGPK